MRPAPVEPKTRSPIANRRRRAIVWARAGALALSLALGIVGFAAHAQSPELLRAYEQSNALRDQGRFAEAEAAAREALRLSDAEFGPDDPNTASLANNLADLYREQGRLAAAEPLHRRALETLERTLGPEHPALALPLNSLGMLRYAEGRLAEAGPFYQRALAIREAALGPDHAEVATILNNLAALFVAQSRYGEAEPLYRRTLAIWEVALGPEHPAVGTALSNLGDLYRAQARYAEAEALYARALTLLEGVFGPDHPELAPTLNNLAALHHLRGRYADAETLYLRTLSIVEQVLGPQHPNLAIGLDNLAELYRALGRFAEAEALFHRALAILESALGLEHPAIATTLNNLALLHHALARYEDAAPLFARALAVQERALGAEHTEVATTLNNLAGLAQSERRYAEAEPLYRRALAIRERVLGPTHPDVAGALSNLAGLLDLLGRRMEAEALYRRAIEILERSFRGEHPSQATALANLAELYRIEDHPDRAEPLLREALAIQEKTLGPDHPEVALILGNLAATEIGQGRLIEALDSLRRATAIRRHRALEAPTGRNADALASLKRRRGLFLAQVGVLVRLAETASPADAAAHRDEAFEVAQLARATSTATALARMAARFAAGDDALADAIREREEAAQRWHALDARLLDALGKPPHARDAAAEARLRADRAALDTRLRTLDEMLGARFPAYAELSNPAPLALAEAAVLLGPDEALLVYMVGLERTFLWVVRRERATLRHIPVGAAALSDEVARVRAGLDPTTVSRIGDLARFDTGAAHRLYNTLLADVAPLLEDARHLLVVPDGALESLPFGVLLTAPPPAALPDIAAFRTLPWLAKSHATTVLPAASSLRALRRLARASRADAPFLGIGDPLLLGHPGPRRGAHQTPAAGPWASRPATGVDLAGLFRGGLADVTRLRLIPALPDTADELAEMARSLGAQEGSLYLRERANEPAVRTQITLADYRIVAFATHGVVAGELAGIAEPALVLTPPAEASAADDGLLTASEIAQLSLDSDWVILSACNTAASDGTPGAEGLSGLAKAFFYAGARALFVSHWPVESRATVKLTTRMLSERAADPTLGRAEAHQRAMLALMNDPDAAHHAHPLFWAPFVVVGAGGAQR